MIGVFRNGYFERMNARQPRKMAKYAVVRTWVPMPSPDVSAPAIEFSVSSRSLSAGFPASQSID